MAGAQVHNSNDTPAATDVGVGVSHQTSTDFGRKARKAKKRKILPNPKVNEFKADTCPSSLRSAAGIKQKEPIFGPSSASKSNLDSLLTATELRQTNRSDTTTTSGYAALGRNSQKSKIAEELEIQIPDLRTNQIKIEPVDNCELPIMTPASTSSDICHPGPGSYQIDDRNILNFGRMNNMTGNQTKRKGFGRAVAVKRTTFQSRPVPRPGGISTGRLNLYVTLILFNAYFTSIWIMQKRSLKNTGGSANTALL
jgi:hypothetical protein